MNEQEKLKRCSGCYNDFYNHRGEGVGKCWSLPRAELVERVRVHIDQRPPWTQKAEKVFQCRTEQRYVFMTPERRDENNAACRASMAREESR
jgi:hypothetical protein